MDTEGQEKHVDEDGRQTQAKSSACEPIFFLDNCSSFPVI